MSAFAPVISMVTLGVRDVAASTAFYEALGWHRSGMSNEGVSFFHLDGTKLGLFGRGALAADAGVADTPTGFAAVTLAQTFGSEAEVDGAFAHAIACGATAVKAPQTVFWGGYSGYFADPDGHLWEVAHNPFAPNDADGFMGLPE